jgi:transcriptional regulator with GAF, ATPase, and Fis domain
LLRVEDPSSAKQALLQIKSTLPAVPVVVGLETRNAQVVAAWQDLGAAEVVGNDVTLAEMRSILNRYPTRPAWQRCIVGNCKAVRRIVETIRLIAERRSTVLITGETGTGKEVIARALHEASGRAGPLITVNCTALPESLMEAELFGHTKGAFTGAQNSRVGRFEAAHRGTIFLDEIGDMPLELQGKLLRVLQEREIQRLGSSESISIDVRVIAATNADLMSKVEDGRFRQDLYFRLNVVPIHLPPLREREEDLIALAWHFLRKVCAAERIPLKSLSPDAEARLRAHPWPGNIREMENTIERAVALSGDCLQLQSDHLMLADDPAASLTPPSEITLPEHGIDFEQIVTRLERSMIEQALRKTNGNKSQAAELLRLKRTTLNAKIRMLAATA